MMWVSILLTLSLSLVNCINEECLQDGECQLGLPVGNIAADTIDGCLQFCQGVSDCSFFSYDNETKICGGWDSCPQLSSELCPNCVSGGILECSGCLKPGSCIGPALGLEYTPSPAECLNLCNNVEGCEWFSYFELDSACLLTTECDIVDETCIDSCSYGQRICGEDNNEPSRLMVLGGDPVNSRSDVEIVNLGQGNTCNKPADLPTKIDGGFGALVAGEIIVCGGQYNANCYKYSIEDNVWYQTEGLEDEIYYGSEVLIDNDTWWITGGEQLSESQSESTYIYQDGSFQSGPDLPYKSRLHCHVKVNETHVFLAGGQNDGGAYTKSAYIIDWTTKEWTKVGDMDTVRGSQICGKVGNNVLVVGGYNNNDGYLDTTEIFSLETETWSPGPKAPRRLCCAQDVFQKDDTFVILGGYDNAEQYITDIYEVNPDTFELVKRDEELAIARDYHVVIPLPDSLTSNC